MKQRIFISTAFLAIGVAIGFLVARGLSPSIPDRQISAAGLDGSDTPYTSGDFRFGLQNSPEKLVVGDNSLTLVLRSQDGAPVSGAKVSGFVEMPAMGAMPAMRVSVEPTEEPGGIYKGAFEIPMKGAWPLTLRIEKPGAAVATFSFDMGTSRPGMRLSSGAVSTGEVRQGVTGGAPEAPTPKGTVIIDSVRRQLIGVKTAVVTRQPMYRTLRAYGRVGADQTRMSDISLKYDVWIGELKADFVGAKVKKGDVLFTIFSPDLYAAQQEYLQITKRSKASSAALLDAARKRLIIWGMTSDQVRALEVTGAAREYVPILSELDGYVVSKTIVEGTGAPAGSSLMRIADLSSLWIEADIYEADFSLIKLGTPATITLSYSQKMTLEGRVDYVYPIMQHDTRTGRVRFSFSNPDGTLRPGMYAEANFRVHLGQHFAVPEEAVLVAGNKRIVFTDIGQGRLAPQYVTTGRQADGLVEILSGLDEGDRIVTSGNFLIASESKLRAGIKQW